MVPAPTSTGAATGGGSPWASQTFTHIIDGKEYVQDGAKMLDVINPATEKVVSRVPIATQKVVDDAVKSARAAFPAWKALGWDARKDMLKKFHETVYPTLREQSLPLYVAEQGRPMQMAEIEWHLIEAFWDLDKYYRPQDEIISDDGENKTITRQYPVSTLQALYGLVAQRMLTFVPPPDWGVWSPGAVELPPHIGLVSAEPT